MFFESLAENFIVPSPMSGGNLKTVNQPMASSNHGHAVNINISRYEPMKASYYVSLT